MTVFSRLRLVVSASFFGFSLMSGVAQTAAPVKTVTVQAQSVAASPAAVSAGKVKPAGVRPRINGPDGAVITTLNFGNVAVGSSGSDRITFQAGNVTFTTAEISEFRIGSTSCDADVCTATITFSPILPGLRRDAVFIKDASNNVVGETFVYGIGVGAQVGVDLGKAYTFGTEVISQAAAVAIGPDGAVYYSDSRTQAIYKVRFAPDGTETSTTLDIAGLANASIAAIAVDGSNTVFLADVNSSTIISYTQIPVDTDTTTHTQGVVSTSPLRTPRAMAVDGTGALYILDAGNARIIKIDVQGAETVLATGLQNASGLAVDGNGNVFYADQDQGGEVVELPGGTGAAVRITSSIGAEQAGLAVDPGGRIYVSAFNGLLLVSPSKQSIGYSVGSSVYNVQVANNGDIFSTTPGNQQFQFYHRTGPSVLLLQAQAGVSTSGSVRLENTGNDVLALRTISVSGTEFTIDTASSTCVAGGTVQPGEGCNVVVNFTAPAAMKYQETLTITSNDYNSPSLFTLNGQGPPSTTTFTYSPASPATGSPVTVTATVVGATNVFPGGQSFPPSGTVQFIEGTTVLGTADLGTATGVTATATTTLTFANAGLHTIYANYLGSATVDPSQSQTSTFAVTAAGTPTTTMVGTSNSRIQVGDSETLGGQVTASSLTVPLTGTLTFFDQNGTLGSAPVTSDQVGGNGAIMLSTLGVGTHTVGVTYSGDSNYSGSTGQGLLVIVSLRTTTTSLALSATNISQGQTVTATAVVGGATSTPIGRTVTFSDQNGVLASTIVTSSNGVYSATADLRDLPSGTHTITAHYDGDSTYAASTSPSMTVTVGAATPATTTTLTVNPAASTYLAPVTLSAQVQSVLPSGGVPLTSGQVVFCDAAATVCNAVFNLGTAQLNGTGTATLRLAPGTVGTHGYKAVFLATTAQGTSTSATATATVTGTYSALASITSTGVAGSYGLTGTVVGAGTTNVGPGGMVTFRDTTNTTNPVLGSAALGASVLSFTESQAPGAPNAVGKNPYGIAAGDFNNDGIADIVTGNYGGGSVSVLIGTGGGGFQPGVSYAVGTLPERVLVADFDGDGNQDLVVANTGSNTVGILLGNGDGTFKTQVTYAALSPVGLGVLDINHDGFADIVAGDYYAGTISVLLGNGDGTFNAAVTYATGSTPQTLAEGDFDGDGNIDVAVGNFGSGTVSVFLGNGDGTFKTQVTYPVGRAPQGVQVGDFNRDGIEDLAVVNSGDNTVGILFGQTGGTFAAQVTYPVGVDPVGLAVADFNGDGFLDLTVGNTDQTDLTQSVLLGNGDGTFQVQTKYATGNFPYGEAIADFNGDGFPDIAISNYVANTATVLRSEVIQTATASVSGIALSGTPGTHNVIASYPGDTNFGATDSDSIPLTALATRVLASTTTLTITPAAATVGQSVVFAVKVTSTPQLAVAPAGNVTLVAVSGTTMIPLGTVTLDGTGAGSLSNATLAAGTYEVIATYGGGGAYAASASGQQALTVSLVTQTITFPAIVNHVSTDAPFALTATASSGLAVSYSVVSGPATVSGSTLTLTGTAGTVVVQASQAGNTTYAAATPVTRSFSATPPAVTLTGVSPASVVVGSGATTVTLTGTNFAAGDVVSFNTTVLASTVVNATTLTAVLPAASLTTIGTGQISVKDPATGITSLSVTFTVTSKNVPTLASLTPAAAVAGAGATTVTVAGTNFTSKSTVQFNGTVIDSTFFDAKTIFAIVPAALLKTAGTAQVTVTDPASAITTAALTFTISATPAIVFTGPSTAPSGQQPTLNFTLTNPYPVALSGTLGLTFVPSSATPGADDPAVQFSAGGRSLNFTIPANSTVTPAVQLQTGTVAGIATATLNVFDPNGDNLTPSNVVPIVITIPAAIPTLTNVSLVRSGQTLNVVVSGFSNTREVSKAVFHFTAASGSSVDTPDVTADVTGLFAQWYGSAPSVPFGSTVIYTQTFNLDHDASSIGSVSVTLTNSIGVSTSASAQ